MATNIYNFPGFSDPTEGGDISVLQIYPPFEFGSSVNSISVNVDSGLEEAGVVATTTGWGDLYYDGPTSDVLQKVDVTIISNEEATTLYSVEITEEMIAAGDTVNGGEDSCNGDSGGPLAVFDSDSGEYVLVGVTSWGSGCGDKDFPGIYARPSAFLSFINSIISESPEDQDQNQELSGAEGSWTFWFGEIPENVESVLVTLSGGTGDADLLVRFADRITTLETENEGYDCVSANDNNNESCFFEASEIPDGANSVW
eukprot:CAMPEP_0174275018 /NCGR_PEP_ID=MMETSP0439-20130205/59601_1 /TAXON_ID=0 /ORGANISM="Stereomyxa ramosa, Strain Chinc5" /LENGTH=256 /DNA_ID=CAMNT_0015367091 /DNA_START=359 /DNA_END=1126 /DNA_ORIENTATION=+